MPSIYGEKGWENHLKSNLCLSRNRSIFPTDDSLFKLLYIVTKDVSKKWNTPKWNWGIVMSLIDL